MSPQARREQVQLAVVRGHSTRRACGLIGVARSMMGYGSVLADKDAPAIAAMRSFSAQYPRSGYRRIRIFLGREGHRMGPERAHRLWKLAGLQLPKRRPRRRLAASRPRPLPPQGPNHVWAYDFIFDASANGQQIKCLTVVDEFTRECLAIDVAGSIRSSRVIDVLSRLVSGEDKTAATLEPTGTNALAAKGSFKIGAGTQALATITLAGRKPQQVTWTLK